MICRNTNVLSERDETSVESRRCLSFVPNISSVAAMRGTTSVAGAAGNAGAEGTRRLGTARGPSAAATGRLGDGTGTCVGAGGAGAGAAA